jgi:hypothetical protein
LREDLKVYQPVVEIKKEEEKKGGDKDEGKKVGQNGKQ